MLLLQIVWRKLMLNEFLDMLFSRMGKALELHILWKNSTQMWLGGVSIMGVSYSECGRKLHPFPSISKSPLWINVSFPLFCSYDCRRLYYYVLFQFYIGFQWERVPCPSYPKHQSLIPSFIYVGLALGVLFLGIISTVYKAMLYVNSTIYMVFLTAF